MPAGWRRASLAGLVGFAWLTAPVAGAQAPGPLAANAAFADTLAGSSEERAALAGTLAQPTDLHGLLQLWLLAHDAQAQVALAAATSAVAGCAEPGSTPWATEQLCTATLRFFLRPEDPPASALARAALLQRAPLQAVVCASPAYKLALVASTTAALGVPQAPPQAGALLRRLAEDPDPEVQQAAGAALMTLDR